MCHCAYSLLLLVLLVLLLLPTLILQYLTATEQFHQIMQKVIIQYICVNLTNTRYLRISFMFVRHDRFISIYIHWF